MQVRKIEVVYQALNSAQQLPHHEQSDALAACISLEFPACSEDAAALVHGESSTAVNGMSTIQAVKSSEGGNAAVPCVGSRSDDQHPDGVVGITSSVVHGNALSKSDAVHSTTDPASQDLPFEPVGKMTAIQVRFPPCGQLLCCQCTHSCICVYSTANLLDM